MFGHPYRVVPMGLKSVLFRKIGGLVPACGRKVKVDKTMPLKRICSCVAVVLLLCLVAAPTLGQETTLGYQYCAPADCTTFGGMPPPNEGYFFQFDGIYWSISGPSKKPIGYPGSRTVWYSPTRSAIQTNSLDTSMIGGSTFSAGPRIEFGHIEDRNGWFMSIFQLRDKLTDYVAPAADIVFNDPQFGPLGQRLLQGNVNTQADPVIRNLPVTLYDVSVAENTDFWGVELNYLHRFMTSHCGGTLEGFLGVRYFEFNDDFRVQAGSDPGNGTVPSFLADSEWETWANNHIVAPQVGVRWWRKQGRWKFIGEGRFLAGFNNQSISQDISLGPNLNPGSGALYTPLVMSPSGHTSSEHVVEWAPGAEVRVEAEFQVTRSISVHGGWTGMWVDGIARSSSLINYTVPHMGIDLEDNRESLFVNGISIGVVINR